MPTAAAHPVPPDATSFPSAAEPPGYRAVRELTLALAAPLTPEDQALQSMPDASPTKWHLAHTTWFFETFLLQPFLPGYEAFHPAFHDLYNSYYLSVGEPYPRARRGLLSRPSLEEVKAYRAHVDAAMGRLWAARAGEAELEARLVLGLNHEQQHQELLLTDALHLLGQNPLRPAYRAPRAHPRADPRPLGWVDFPGGLVEIGHGGPGFAFDCEGPRHRAYLAPYRLAERLVTCGEFLDFIHDGGYRNPALWCSDGWTAARAEGWKAPMYWEQVDGAWCRFGLEGLRPLVGTEPAAHLSWYEADAYARWAGARLPTEAEWEAAAQARPLEGGFLDSGALAPHPCEGRGLGQLFGELWQWTASPFVPYPGYRPPEGALGEYNGKFMANQMVLRGGSFATPRDHLRPSYRNFFPPTARWQFTGLRLARDTA